MCFNCNCGRYFNSGICPHKEDKPFIPELLKDISMIRSPQEREAVPCKSYAKYKGYHSPKCNCLPCWQLYLKRWS